MRGEQWFDCNTVSAPALPMFPVFRKLQLSGPIWSEIILQAAHNGDPIGAGLTPNQIASLQGRRKGMFHACTCRFFPAEVWLVRAGR